MRTVGLSHRVRKDYARHQCEKTTSKFNTFIQRFSWVTNGIQVCAVAMVRPKCEHYFGLIVGYDLANLQHKNISELE